MTNEDEIVVFHFRLPKELHDKMENIASRATQAGERANVSLVYREAVRKYIASHEDV